MERKRQTFNKDFKVKVALEALREKFSKKSTSRYTGMNRTCRSGIQGAEHHKVVHTARNQQKRILLLCVCLGAE